MSSLSTPAAANKGKLFTFPFLMVTLLSGIVTLLLQMTVSAMPLFLVSLGVARTFAGSATTACTLAALCFRPLAAALTDRFGEKAPALCGALLYVAVFCSYGFCSSLTAVLCLRIMQGAGMSIITTALGSAATAIVPQDQLTRGMSYYSLGNAVALCIGPAIGIYLVERYPFSALFLFGAVLSALSVLLLFLTRTEKAVTITLSAAGKGQPSRQTPALRFSRSLSSSQRSRLRYQTALSPTPNGNPTATPSAAPDIRDGASAFRPRRSLTRRRYPAADADRPAQSALPNAPPVTVSDCVADPVTGAGRTPAYHQDRDALTNPYNTPSAHRAGLRNHPFFTTVIACGALLPSSVFSLMILCQTALTTYLAFFAAELGIGGASAFFSCNVFGMVASKFVLDRLCQRLGSGKVAAGCAVLLSAAFLLISLSGWFAEPGLWCAGVFYGFGYGGMYTLLNVEAVRHATAKNRGTANSLFLGAKDIGTAAGSLAWGALTILGYPLLFALAALISLSLLFFYRFLTGPQTTPSHPRPIPIPPENR